MVSYNSTKYLAGRMYIEGECLSSDTKPTENILNGSKLMEMDTATLYMYDEENNTWRAWE